MVGGGEMDQGRGLGRFKSEFQICISQTCFWKEILSLVVIEGLITTVSNRLCQQHTSVHQNGDCSLLPHLFVPMSLYSGSLRVADKELVSDKC